jgi:secretion/DNA translocation related TadE-like protein
VRSRAKADRERGAATIWVLATLALVLAVACTAALRAQAVLARHRAEAAADLAALAAAGQIGLSVEVCRVAADIAAANHATIQQCVPKLDPGGRSGTVVIRVVVRLQLPVVGAESVTASARAGRAPPSP